MRSQDPSRTSIPPLFLQRRSTDEYDPVPHSAADHRVLRQTAAVLRHTSERTGTAARALVSDRVGTAIGLRALNDEWGAEFFEVPDDATVDAETATAVLGGDEVVIDVQTHFLAPHSRPFSSAVLGDMYRAVMPAWWTELDDVVARDLGDYITNVFLECETSVAVLTSGPGVDDTRTLWNDEMAATRALIDGLAGSGRLLNHAVVHADLDAEVEGMEETRDQFDPVGWKVYTPGRFGADGWISGWMLDDHEHGFPFLERARALGVSLVCAHKGISLMVDNGSPRDIGPAAKAFPDLNFVVYHSGFEFAEGDEEAEGPYTDETAHLGVNRLLRSLDDAGIGAGANVYAELGTTWFSLIRRPREAAHLLGKLISRMGEDRVVWGSDSIWYGSAQPLIDALRVFQIPDEMCEKFGYQKLTPRVKAKILGENSAGIYGIDLDEARRASSNDDLAWARRAIADFRATGFDALR